MRKPVKRTNKSFIPPDFPHKHRLGGPDMFRELLGNPGKSTFARYLILGIVPPPDAKLGQHNRWRETTMAAPLAVIQKSARQKKLYDQYVTALGELP